MKNIENPWEKSKKKLMLYAFNSGCLAPDKLIKLMDSSYLNKYKMGKDGISDDDCYSIVTYYREEYDFLFNKKMISFDKVTEKNDVLEMSIEDFEKHLKGYV